MNESERNSNLARNSQTKTTAEAILALELLFPAEDMSVVLREAADPEKARENAALLVAIDRPELGEPQRELPVGAGPRSEDLHVEGAVHRLQEIALVIGFEGRKHGLPVEVEVSARLPEEAPSDVRRVHQLVASRDLLLPPVVLEEMAYECALGMPEREPRPDGVFEREELELAPEPSVVLEHGILPRKNYVESLEGGNARSARGPPSFE